jgi:CDP-diacylglycerol--serine O-phosphatidyltransferase
MKRHIPNFVTCLNLFSGCVGVVFALQGKYQEAAYCVVLSGIFDFFDGLAARALNVKSPIGKELDSLADVISFGLLPGAILYQLLQATFPGDGLIPYLGFVVTAFSALRLAKFNIDDRQTTDFIGLNTPMNAIYVTSLPFIAETYPHIVLHPAFLLGTVALNSLLLVSSVRLFSMKLTSVSWNTDKWRFIFLIISAGLVIGLRFAAAPLVLGLYFLCSFLHFRNPSYPDKT